MMPGYVLDFGTQANPAMRARLPAVLPRPPTVTERISVCGKQKRKFDFSEHDASRRRGKKSSSANERVRLKRKRFFGRAGANGDSITCVPAAGGTKSIETHCTATGVVFTGRARLRGRGIPDGFCSSRVRPPPDNK